MKEYLIFYGFMGGGALGAALGAAGGTYCAVKLYSLFESGLTEEELASLREAFRRRDDLPDPIVVDDCDSANEVEENIHSLDDLTEEEQRQIMQQVEQILSEEHQSA